jgi:carbon-monoxide dehydrogenase medium subunit
VVTFYRRLPKFDYLSPQTIGEALALLARHGKKARLMAGGTDLVPKLKRRSVQVPEYIIDLKGIPGLDYIKYKKGDGLKIGALATINDIEKSAVIREKYNILFQAAESMASPQVRHRGTIAGNICNAVPSADTAPALLALEAKVKLVSKKGERTVDLIDFFKGPSETVLKPDELLAEIEVPDLPPGSRGKYLKLTPRRAMDLAVVGVAVVMIPNGETCGDIRIALGAVSPTPVRATTAEEMLRGQKPDAGLIGQAAATAAASCCPINDHRASAEYRTEMVKVLTRQAINDLWQLN